MTQKKLTKHQMKEDKLVTSLFKAWEWGQLHGKQLGLGIGSVVILILVVILYGSYQSSRTSRAADLFGQASIEMQTPMASQVQAAVTDFQILLKDYPRSKWSPYACFYLANMLFRDGQYAQAKEYYQKYVNEYKEDSLMTASAYAGIAECLLEEKDFLSAGEYYLKGAEVSPRSILAPEYLLQAGQSYLKGEQKQKAIEVFQRVALEYPNSPYGNTARQELMRIPIS
jgi:TolA-binding protein